MSKATENQLSVLHSRVTKALLDNIERADRATALLEEYKDDVPDKVRQYLEESTQINPSVLAAATKFLKDNDITCDIGSNEEMSALEERLAKKRKASGSKIVDIGIHD